MFEIELPGRKYRSTTTVPSHLQVIFEENQCSPPSQQPDIGVKRSMCLTCSRAQFHLERAYLRNDHEYFLQCSYVSKISDEHRCLKLVTLGENFWTFHLSILIFKFCNY